jgi:hypothetical protein
MRQVPFTPNISRSCCSGAQLVGYGLIACGVLRGMVRFKKYCEHKFFEEEE